MSEQSYFDATAKIAVIGVGVCEGPAQHVGGLPVNEKGEQLGIGTSRVTVDGVPVIVVSVILGDRQITAALDPSQADRFCHQLADGVLWQNGQMREAGGKAVH